MNALPCTIYLSFTGALLALLIGKRSALGARIVALATALLGLEITLSAAFSYIPNPHGLTTLVNTPWISQLGIHYYLAVDGISLTLLILTGLATTAGILFSWNIQERVGEFFALYLVLIGGVYGVFMSADAFLFFVFYEIAIVPKYFLVAIWGSKNKEYGAMKLVLYSFVGSSLVLAGLIWTYAASGASSFGLPDLIQASSHLTHIQHIEIFGLIFFGFATLAGLFPLHTWAPTGHVAAPTAASMLLAGVVMKLGAYGCLRVALPLFPQAIDFWQPIIACLAVLGVIYAGLIALIQEDFKYVIGYSSVSHMGFVILGLISCNLKSLSGAVLQMFSHGIIAGLLFAVVGRMVYERTHTRNLNELKTMSLGKRLPFVACVFVIAGLASMGMPAFSGFPAELTILIGTWKVSAVWATAAAVGILISAAFTLRAIQLAFFSDAKSVTSANTHAFAPITLPEKLGSILLIGTTLIIGLKPDLLFNLINPALQSPYFENIIKGVTS